MFLEIRTQPTDIYFSDIHYYYSILPRSIEP
nr:MAG TPA: hypothetical protein [Caudoviricetes sp.]